jgi:hypothetical protein
MHSLMVNAEPAPKDFRAPVAAATDRRSRTSPMSLFFQKDFVSVVDTNDAIALRKRITLIVPDAATVPFKPIVVET